MRDIKDYSDKYVYEPFESTMVRIRKREVINQCKKYKHNTILEIGCGMNPFFLDFRDYDKMVIAEPGELFAQNASELSEKEGAHVEIVRGFLEDTVEKVKGICSGFDYIILSSVLHELDSPSKMLVSIRGLCDKDTVVHINVPNANSIHRLIAIESGLIKDVHEQSEQMKKMQRRRTYDLKLLIDEVQNSGFEVVESGSYFIKPFTHAQMQKCMDEGIIDETVIVGLERIVTYLPGFGSEIFVNVRKKTDE